MRYCHLQTTARIAHEALYTSQELTVQNLRRYLRCMSAVCQPDTSCFILINFLRISVADVPCFAPFALIQYSATFALFFRAISRVY